MNKLPIELSEVAKKSGCVDQATGEKLIGKECLEFIYDDMLN